MLHIWDMWFPNAAATGLSFARARIEPADVVWLHSTPKTLRIEVRDDAGARVAFADQLEREGRYFPMTRIERRGDTLVREDRWPSDSDLPAIVILPGGEAGVMQTWWNADDGSEWRWTVEFYNRR